MSKKDIFIGEKRFFYFVDNNFSYFFGDSYNVIKCIKIETKELSFYLME